MEQQKLDFTKVQRKCSIWIGDFVKYQVRRRTYKRSRKARRPQSRKQSTFSVKKMMKKLEMMF